MSPQAGNRGRARGWMGGDAQADKRAAHLVRVLVGPKHDVDAALVDDALEADAHERQHLVAVVLQGGRRGGGGGGGCTWLG